MNQQCEAPVCDEPADFTFESPTPGGTIHLCAMHAKAAMA